MKLNWGTSIAIFYILFAATMVGFDAINDFSRFTAMEYIASKAELDALRAKYAWAEYFAFPEDRSLSIRMADDIPAKWAQEGPFRPFTGTAARGEYYTFQVGVWAHRMAIDSMRYEATAFTRKGGTEVIPASAVTCFNLEGVDWSGRRFARALRVERGKVQPLWFGVQIPRNAVPGDYEGEVAIGSSNAKDRPVHFQEVFSTLYHNLGIDADKVTLNDLSGRPQYLVDNNYQPLRELI